MVVCRMSNYKTTPHMPTPAPARRVELPIFLMPSERATIALRRRSLKAEDAIRTHGLPVNIGALYPASTRLTSRRARRAAELPPRSLLK